MKNYIGEKATRGDMFWIEPSPYRGNGENVMQARRPGIIVSSDIINKDEFVYEIVYLTTKPKKDLPTYCTIRSSQRPSTAICDQITTISSEQLGSYLGSITAEEMANIELCMMISLDLDAPTGRKQGKPDDTDQVRDLRVLNENQRLKEDLLRVQAEKDLIMKMYNDLLAKTIRKKRESSK